MISAKNTVVAHGVIFDEATKLVSIFNIMEDLIVGGFPTFIQKIYYFSYFTREEGDSANITLELIIKNNDKEIAKEPIQINFGDKYKNRTRIELGGMPILEEGKMSFIVKHETRELSKYEISIKKINEPLAQNSGIER